MQYQWYKNNYADEESIIEGATESSYELAGNEEARRYYYYYCEEGIYQLPITSVTTKDSTSISLLDYLINTSTVHADV